MSKLAICELKKANKELQEILECLKSNGGVNNPILEQRIIDLEAQVSSADQTDDNDVDFVDTFGVPIATNI